MLVGRRRPAQEEADFWNFVANDEYLNSHRGQVAERNGVHAPWVNQFDLRISQELPGFFEGHKAELWLDILNVGNLINKDWGQHRRSAVPGQCAASSSTAASIRRPASTSTAYNGAGPADASTTTSGISRWSLQVGFRYKF